MVGVKYELFSALKYMPQAPLHRIRVPPPSYTCNHRMFTDGWHPAIPRPHVIEAEERALQFLIFPRHVQAEPSLDVSTCPGWAAAFLGAIVGNAGKSSARRSPSLVGRIDPKGQLKFCLIRKAVISYGYLYQCSKIRMSVSVTVYFRTDS